MNSKSYIGVDIGGTKITAGCIKDGKLITKATVETGASQSVENILNNLFATISEVATQEISGIGLGVPGYLNVDEGKVILCNNIPAFTGLNLVREIEKQFNCSVAINNDANCFVLGESLFGPGANYRNTIGLTLGTGVGGGIVVNEKIISGIYGGAGEFGCIPYLDTSFEDYCGGKFFINQYKIGGQEMYQKAMSGEKNAIKAFEKFGEHVANLIRYIMYFMAPEAVIIGGSVANAFELFQSSLEKNLKATTETHLVDNIKILKAELSDAAVYGAASLVMN